MGSDRQERFPLGLAALWVLGSKRLRQRALRATLRTFAPQIEPEFGLANVRLDASILVYFGDGPQNLYQLEQWLGVLEHDSLRTRVAIVVRRHKTFLALRTKTTVPVVLITSFADLEALHRANDFKVCLYVNNSAANFHNLMYRDLLHVHINHGESDKESMASNQAKAYDLVFVAGQAAEERYRNGLINFDGSSVRKVGRPQIDIPGPVYPPSDRPTVLYAPTWEGGRPSMDTTSVGPLGIAIVESIVRDGRYRLIYRPHPKAGSVRPEVAHADAHIRRLIHTAPPAAGHAVEQTAPLSSLLAASTLLIGDVSSVSVDHLATGKPLIVTDPRSSGELADAVAVARVAAVVSPATVGTVIDLLRDEIENDPHRDRRLRLAAYYFGDLTPGASLGRFVEAVDDAITARDEAILRRDQSRRSTVTTLPSTRTSSASMGA